MHIYVWQVIDLYKNMLHAKVKKTAACCCLCLLLLLLLLLSKFIHSPPTRDTDDSEVNPHVYISITSPVARCTPLLWQ